MKITRVKKENDFKPFNIMVETLEEAELIWHRLNINNVQCFERFHQREDTILKYGMWELINKELQKQNKQPNGTY